MRGLKDKVVIVSGGATLIGAAIARAFVAEGARVTIADIDTRGGGALASELGECSRFIATDVSRDVDIDACVAATLKAFGRIDCLVNVAAIYADSGPASPREDWEKAFAVNVFGAAMFLRACRPHMKDGGAVVNFGSTSAGVAQAGRWTYPATKAAVRQLTRSAALDLAADGIRVNAVSPGWTWSGILDQLSGGDRDKVNALNADGSRPTSAKRSDDLSGWATDIGVRLRLDPQWQVGAAYSRASAEYEQNGLQSNRSNWTGTQSRVHRFGEAFRGEMNNMQSMSLFGSWQLREDYDASLISEGGGVFSRDASDLSLIARAPLRVHPSR